MRTIDRVKRRMESARYYKQNRDAICAKRRASYKNRTAIKEKKKQALRDLWKAMWNDFDFQAFKEKVKRDKSAN